ncbi:hypothetical protein MKX03_018254 [Papaver bracteatum]|nr:hypothetical protein MKX03_018254 [Papaver bracteatum]
MASKKPNHVVVLVMAFPYGTHAIPLLNLVRRLAIQAPTLTFSFFSTSKSNQSVFWDSFSVCDMADELGVPLISFWTAGPCSLSTNIYIDLIRQSITLGSNGIDGREEELIDFIPELSLIRIKDLQEGVLYGCLNPEFSLMMHKMGPTLPRATAVTMNSFAELDLPILEDFKCKFQKCLTLGPFTLTSQNPSHAHDDSNGCLTWLDKQTPTSVVYISFGTVTTPPSYELAALPEGLEESGVPFLWSLKGHSVCQLPDGFLQRTSKMGCIVPWTPQQQVLGNNAVGIFVTHYGWNSVMESITAGVPMICRPFFGDQRINCRMISDVWGLGTMIKDRMFTKAGMMKCLDVIFSEGKLREKVVSLRGIAKHVVGPKESSTKNFNTLTEIVCKD